MTLITGPLRILQDRVRWGNLSLSALTGQEIWRRQGGQVLCSSWETLIHFQPTYMRLCIRMYLTSITGYNINVPIPVLLFGKSIPSPERWMAVEEESVLPSTYLAYIRWNLEIYKHHSILPLNGYSPVSKYY